jgi:hypothetical protein
LDVEKTVEFLLESQAKTETRLVAITDLLHTGVRMLVNVQEASAIPSDGSAPWWALSCAPIRV